jgi:protein deglycase
MKTACVLLADGFEEVEALTPVDYLRRAGIEVTVLGVTGSSVTGAHGVVVVADATLPTKAIIFDAVVVPGGMPGASNIAGSSAARELILRHFHEGRLVAAICAAPAVVLHTACGILRGRRFTGYPGTESQAPDGLFTPGRVVRDGNLITSRGPGCAGEFALAIVGELAGAQTASRIAQATLER